MSRSVKPKKERPVPAVIEEAEEVLTLVRATECEIRGRDVVRGELVKVSPKRPFDSKSFWAVFMYAYVDEQTKEVYEVTVYGGQGFLPHRKLDEQGEAEYRTFEPYRVTVVDGASFL